MPRLKNSELVPSQQHKYLWLMKQLWWMCIVGEIPVELENDVVESLLHLYLR